MDSLRHSLGPAVIELSAATAIGPYHVRAGLPNQDAYDHIAQPGFLALAVADGAGSLERSDEGSALAVEAGAGTVADLILRSHRQGVEPELPRILAEAILEARSAVLSLPHWKQTGSTVVLAALTESSFAVAVVGDSFAVIQSAAEELKLVQPPSAGEYANITKLLTSDGFTVAMAYGSLSSLRGLSLCSDAFEHATLEQRVPTRGFWSRIFELARSGKLNVEELISFMDGQGKIEDDATLIGLGITGIPETNDPILELELDLEELKEFSTNEQSSDELKHPRPPEESPHRGIPRDI